VGNPTGATAGEKQEDMMKKLALFTAVAGLTLVGAAPPSQWSHGANGDEGAGRGYPPCSRTVTDRCIQLYERGVRTRANLALNERLGMNGRGSAMGGPYEPAGDAGDETAAAWPRTSRTDYPACSRTVTDRCIQLHERGVRRIN
jgi:hypothetical protein